MYSGHTRCPKCGQVHWMHGDCPTSMPKQKIDLRPVPEAHPVEHVKIPVIIPPAKPR